VFTVLPHFVLRYCQIRPEVAYAVLLATYGGLSLEGCDRALPNDMRRRWESDSAESVNV
jgi:hypothetical protein